MTVRLLLFKHIIIIINIFWKFDINDLIVYRDTQDFIQIIVPDWYDNNSLYI